MQAGRTTPHAEDGACNQTIIALHKRSAYDAFEETTAKTYCYSRMLKNLRPCNYEMRPGSSVETAANTRCEGILWRTSERPWRRQTATQGKIAATTYRYSRTIMNLKACKNVLSLSMCNDETIPCSSVEAAAETQCNLRMS